MMDYIQESESNSGENGYWYGKFGANNPSSKKVICITTGEIFYSVAEASKKYNTYTTCISKNCIGIRLKSAGKHPETGEKLVWMYYEDYLESMVK